MTGNNKVWRASLAGLASVAMLATMGVSAANAADGYKLTLVAANGDVSVVNDAKEIGLAQLNPSGNTPSGQTATGWYTAAGVGNGTKVEPGTKLGADTTIYEHSSVNVRNITFNASVVNGVQEYAADTDLDKTQVAVGDKLADWQVPSVDAAADGKVLSGWTVLGADATPTGDLAVYDKTADGKIDVVDEDITFDAKVADAWTVTFHNDSADGTTGNYTLEYTGKKLIADNGAYRVDVNKDNDGYTGDIPDAKYNGAADSYASKWYTSKHADKNQRAEFKASDKVIGNLDLYPDAAVATYTVTFDYADNGKTDDKSVKVVKDQTVAAPADPTRAADDNYEYKFAGWYVDGDYTKDAYNFDTKVQKNITLVAKWAISKVKVTFNAGYGDVKAETKWFADGDQFAAPADPTRDGYTFEGYKASDGTLASDAAGYPVKINQTGYGDSASATLSYVVSNTTPDHTDLTITKTLSLVFTAKWGSYLDSLGKVEAYVNVDKDAKYYTADSFKAYVDAFKTEYLPAKEKASKDELTKGEYQTLLDQLNGLQSKLEETTNLQVYRLYNPDNSTHVYTTNQGEAQKLQEQYGYVNETKDSFKGVSLRKDGHNFGLPVYRLYNKVSGEHLLTVDTAEVKGLIKGDWVADTADGSAWDENLDPTDPAYASKFVQFYTAQNGNVPVYRLYNPLLPQAAQHHYTADKSEADDLVANHDWQYDFEGKAAFNVR